MQTAGGISTVISDEVTHSGQRGSDGTTGARTRLGPWRRVVIVLGIFSAACAIASPLLPVVQDTAEITWPVGTDTRPVNAPLTGYWAQDLRVDLPCPTIQAVGAREPGGASLFSTVPGPRTGNGAGMFLRVEHGVLTAFSRGQQ